MNSRRLLASGLLSALWWPLLQASSFFLATASAAKATRMASSASNLADETTASVDNEMEDEDLDELSDDFQWTAATIVQSIVVFCLAGCAEILGGWLVWAAVRGDSSTTGKKPWWYALVGSVVLVIYGFIPCLQPTDSFGRIYAAYGGFFIVLSFLFGWALDGDKPDLGDVIGGSIALAGVFVVMFWPR